VLVLAAIALAAASCGGGGDGPLSKADYEQQVGAILRPIQETTLPNVLQISPDQADQAIQQLKQAETKLHDDAETLRTMKPPEDVTGPTTELAEGIGRIADQVTSVRKGAESGNFNRLEQFKVQVGSDPAVAQIRAAITELINLGYDVAGNTP
jgi:hypothetical protein